MPVDPDEEAIVTRLRLATMHLSRRIREESSTEAALTPSRYSALSSIDANGPLRLTDLAGMERASKSSITRVVGRLSDARLIELVPDPHDGRSTLVGVTPQGKDVLAAMSERADAYLRQRLADFSAAEKSM